MFNAIFVPEEKKASPRCRARQTHSISSTRRTNTGNRWLSPAQGLSYYALVADGPEVRPAVCAKSIQPEQDKKKAQPRRKIKLSA
jgi:hypothetical protein